MTLRVSDRIKINRTGAATWQVQIDGVNSGAAWTTPEEAERYGFGLVSNAAVTDRGLATKAATAEIQVVTLTSYGGTDSFTLKDPLTLNETVPFVRGTNGTAAAVQAALRTLTGDASLTVAGTTDEGPFTVTWVAETTRQPVLEQGTVSGCTLAVTVSTKGGVG